ncbi:MAG: 4Fe-4S binding protein, partial [Oscillospiraceae bacterium]|nr:4Fe-4S binding protein [Oscillospiraceae bacterium]
TLKDEKAFVAKPEDCIKCKMCEYRCPEMAITVEEEA